MGNRPLQAVLGIPGRELAALLARALEGRGPALLPLSADLPPARLHALLAAMRPATLRTAEGVRPLSDPEPVEEDTAVVVATSGSTGAPKGVELSAAALRHSTRASLQRIGAVGPSGSRKWLCVLPTSHIAGLQVLLRAGAEGTEPVEVRFDPARVMAAARKHRLRVSLVPTQLRRLLAAGADLSAFETILLGGAAAEEGLLAAARRAGGNVITTYGMSETCGGCVYDGLPLREVAASLDADGRIHLAGPVLFSRYRLDPGATGRHLSERGNRRWFATGDLGGWEEGRLRVRGRADDVINTGGHKVAPDEVAEVLGRHPGVAEVAVVGRPDPEWGERVVAVVVPAPESGVPSLADLRDRVREHLPAYAAPHELDVRPSLPLLPSGKPDLAALRGPR